MSTTTTSSSAAPLGFPSFQGYIPEQYVDPSGQLLERMGIRAGSELPARFSEYNFRGHVLSNNFHISCLSEHNQ